MTNIPINSRMHGMPVQVFKTREIFKLQVSLDLEGKVLIYNQDRSKRGELEGGEAKDVREHFGLDRFSKPKTYVYGNGTAGSIALEADGEVPWTPNW